jgi:osmoprotectant transport system permease protein
MIDYLQSHRTDILDALGQHLTLALLPVVLGFAVALPLGYLAHHYGWLRHPLLNLSSILYAIPSLALFVLLPLILGTQILDPANIVVALSVYTVALLVRTVTDGLGSVDAAAIQAATAMGFRPLRRLIQVELPIAVPVIIAGLRVATVSNISLVSVGALIGVGGLGALFTQGLQLSYLTPIIVGMILSMLLAVVFDLLLVTLQIALTPWLRAGVKA